jgi:hypothetical protein
MPSGCRDILISQTMLINPSFSLITQQKYVLLSRRAHGLLNAAGAYRVESLS